MPESLCNDPYHICTVAHVWTCEGHLVPCPDCLSIMAHIFSILIGEKVFFKVGRWWTETSFNNATLMLRYSLTKL